MGGLMTDESTQVVNDDNVAPSNATTTETSEQKDTVDYKTYSRVLGKLKETESKFDELNSKITTFENAESERENAKLQEEGKYQDLISKLTTERDEALGITKVVALDSQIKTAASENGCTDIEALMQLSGDYKDKVVFGSKEAHYKANSDSLNSFIASQKERYPYLFKSTTPPPKDAGHGGTSTNVNVSDMSASELSKLAIQTAKNKGLI